MPAGDLRGRAEARALEELIRGRGDYGHVHVRAHADHLLIEAADSAGARATIARATALGAGQWGLAFRRPAGRWEPMPVVGPMPEVVEGLLECLGPYLARENLA